MQISQLAKNMAKKPSFLERLTGTTKTDEVSIETYNSSLDENKEKIIRKDFSVREPMEEKPKQHKKKDDWLDESEGQLTIDVYQTSNEIVIKSTIAGVRPEDIDVSIANDMVTIKGKRQTDEEVKAEDYYYQECYWGSFSRSVILPVEIDAEQALASMKNGILSIKLPKIEKAKTKKLKVKAE